MRWCYTSNSLPKIIKKIPLNACINLLLVLPVYGDIYTTILYPTGTRSHRILTTLYNWIMSRDRI